MLKPNELSNLAESLNRQKLIAAHSDTVLKLLWPFVSWATIVWYQQSSTGLQPTLYKDVIYIYTTSSDRTDNVIIPDNINKNEKGLKGDANTARWL